MTIVGESSQKLNRKGKTFSSRCGFYLAISKNDESILKKTKVGESWAIDKTFVAMWKQDGWVNPIPSRTKAYSNGEERSFGDPGCIGLHGVARLPLAVFPFKCLGKTHDKVVAPFFFWGSWLHGIARDCTRAH
jgi:hypothetical protein